jgi:copper homeostasis protein
MIRPRGGDFLYTDAEIEVMLADIDAVKSIGGVRGVVLGVLTANGEVDEGKTRMLVEHAQPELGVVFHRAFDMVRDQGEALEVAIRTGCKRILTSGGKKTAVEGKEVLRRLVRLAAGRIEIMAGAGVGVDNAMELVAETGVQSLHLSGSVKVDGGMVYRNEKVSMASTVPGEYERVEADEGKIRRVVELFS